MKRLHAGLVTVSIVLMIAVLARQWEQIEAMEWSIRPILITLAVAGLTLHFFLAAYGWHLITRALGGHIVVRRSIQIWLLSSLTRYLPGGIWSYASRASMAKQENMSIPTVTISLYLETILLAAASLAVGLPSLLVSSGLPVTRLQAGLLLALFTLMVHPRFLGLLRRLPGPVGEAFAKVRLPTTLQLVGLYVYYLALFMLFGLVFSIFAKSLHDLPLQIFPYLAASIALAFCIGFITIIFPSGIGIREGVLFLLLSAVLPGSVSLLIAVASRLWVTCAEAIAVSIALLWRNGDRGSGDDSFASVDSDPS